MAGYQRWVTCARDDKEAWKCLVLERSLKKSLTTRQLGVIFSHQVSEKMRLMLEDEFDFCQQLGPSDLIKFPDLQFRSVAKIFAWKLKGKFVFLDCNCLVLKNSDELFRKTEMVQIVGDGDKDFVALAVVASASSRSKENLDMIIMQENRTTIYVNGNKNAISSELNMESMDFCYELNLKGKYCIPMHGTEIKMVCLTDGHPIDSVLQGLKKSDELNTFEQSIFGFCQSLCPEINTNAPFKSLHFSEPSSKLNNSVAIVGVAFRFPGANNPDEFWNMLEKGHEGICRVPDQRWTKEKSLNCFDDVRKTEAGFLSCNVDKFDAKFFNTNTADLSFMDPQQRLMLQVVWEGLENAGIDPDTLRNTLTGVFGGWWRQDYKEMLQLIGLNENDFFRAYMGNALGTLTARISHFFELVGPSISTESGCSTSIVGVDMACDSLRNENCDVALAVGANLLLHPFSINLMNGVIAMNGRCKTFDAEADGFGRAEGLAVLVLKRYADAVSNGDRIWGLIRGSAVVQEGPSKMMGTPTVECEALAMTLALERAEVHPNQVSYVETHGTGTPVGDPLEVAAVTKAYSSKDRPDLLTIGSVKTNIGHTESVSGLAGIIKTLLALKNELIPPHLNFQTLSPEINLAAIPAQLPLQAIEWKKSTKPRIAGVSSFGITGTDAHVILQETPDMDHLTVSISDSRPVKLFTLSGKTEESLMQQIKLYSQFLKSSTCSLKDVEYTMHVGRAHLPFRHTVVGETIQEISSHLSETEKNVVKALKPISTTAPKICFLFTGQGSQYSGMAQSLYKSSIVFASHFDYCDSILSKEYGFSVKEAVWGPEEEQLKRSLYSQTSIFVVEYCLLKLWESWGITPNTVVGHSLGEFVACIAAGMLTFEEALKLVVTRSKLIDSLPNASMLVVGADLNTVETLLKKAFDNTPDKWLDIAAVNTSEQTVLAGPTESVHIFAEYCENNKMKTHTLESSHAFHSRLMDPMLKEYEKVVSQIKYKEPNKNITFLSGMDGKVVKKVDANYFVRHTREKVRFLEASQAVFNEGETTFLEIGPHPVLSAMMLINSDTADLDQPLVCCASLRKKTDDWRTILTSLGKLYGLGFSINWQNLHRYSNAKKVDIPGYCFEETSYWLAIPNDGSVPFHPLLGAFLPNPSDTKIFKNYISVHRVPFLMDHVLGDKIIFPGAGYLEMCLTAGYSAVLCPEGSKFMKPSGPISIQNFFIESPICLSDKTPTECQVVVNKSTDSGETHVSVFTKLLLDETNFKWIRHTTATFCPTTAITDTIKHEDWKSIRERCSEELSSEFDYSTLEEYGFKFGPSFKNLRKAWKPTNDNEEMLFEFCTNTNLENYLLHPCLVDSMFQAQIISMGKNVQKPQQGPKMLIVPLQIQNFTLWSQLSTKTGFIHVKPSQDKVTIELHDATGQLIATMIGAEFIETTVSNIMSIIESQRNPFPNMYEQLWRDELGPYEKRICDSRRGDIELTEITADKSGKHNMFSPDEEIFYNKSNSLFGLYMLKSLVSLGAKSHISENIIHWPEIGRQLQVLPELDKFLRYLLIELSQDGWFNIRTESCESMEFELLSPLPDLQTISTQIEDVSSEIKLKGIGEVDISCVAPFGENLSEILTGAISALPLLFPEGTNQRGPAERYYMESFFANKCSTLSAHLMPKYISSICALPTKTGGQSVVRILEVGAGTGSATKEFIRQITTLNKTSNFECTYTDLSPMFLQKGEQLFNDTGISAKFGILNIEEDPVAQGFIPGHYDIVAAFYVLHATRNIEESLNNIIKLLKPQGYLILLELTNPNRAINLLFGGLEQFWRFSDHSLRPYNCEISVGKWKTVMEKCGFEDIGSMDCFDSKSSMIFARLQKSFKNQCQLSCPEKPTWIIFGDDGKCSTEVIRNLSLAERNSVLITPHQIFEGAQDDIGSRIYDMLGNITSKLTPANVQGIIYLWGLSEDRNYQEICEPYLHICKYLSHWDTTTLRLVVFTKGNMCVGPSDFIISPPQSSPIIAMTNTICNENHSISGKCVDIDPTLLHVDLAESVCEGLSEIFVQDKENIVAYRKNRRNILRLSPYKLKNTALTLPRSNRYRMILPTSNMISDLKFAAFEQKPLKEDQVEIQVKAYSLNFRDLMVVLKPDPVFKMFHTVGLDYAGIVTSVGSSCSKVKVGDRVLGIRVQGDAMPSHVVVSETHTIPLREGLTFCDGATLPAAFFTVYICLIELAKIKSGDVVLVHTASGGVGLCAVFAALQAKCTIVATAGNEKKRNYLRSLGLEHVFNSRSLDYQQEIEKALGGRGVDVVLNSLTGTGFKEATLAVCAPGARFIEMSKMNIWTKEELQALRPDVIYEIVDLSQKSDKEMEKCFEKISRLMNEIQESGDKMKPLPYTRFDCSEIRKALEYMEKAKHIGKIIVTMPETQKKAAEVNIQIDLFNDNSTYMITGGLGGIGLEVADWMSCRGAKNILLVGRSLPRKEVLEKIDTIKSRGVTVVVKQSDIGNFTECKNLLDSIKDLQLPPVRGIMHAAGVLADQTYENQNWQMFEIVFNAKIKGSWNLHQLTLSLQFPLEHFVMFSSISAQFSPLGQSNHSAGNYFMDSLVHYRNSLGLPATTINWGQWGQVGVAANLNIPAMKPFTLHQGLAVLENTIKTHHTQMLAFEADLTMLSKFFPSNNKLVSEIETLAVTSSFNELDSNAFWEEYDATESREEKCHIVKKYIKMLIRLNMKLSKNEEINDHANFQDLGMDSLMMVEMKNGLQMSVGKRVKISINSVRDCKTVHQLGKRLVELISGKVELPPPTTEELRALILADSLLQEEIKVDGEIIPAQKVSNCSIALITGVTGTLGPYILREVLKQPSIKTVYCLLRENKIFSPKERLTRVLKEKNLLQDIDMDKVTCVVGDVSQPHLGMSDETYAKLSLEVELVLNVAVKSGYGEYYLDTPDLTHTRNVNLNGVKNVLSFASHKLLKHVYHASTMLAETQIGEDGRFWEEWPVNGEMDNENLPNSAYYISKYVSDLLVAQAVQRGIPCKAFRFPNFGGDSVHNGNFQIMDGELMMRLMIYMCLGYMPARNVPISVLPVNFAAEFSISLFFNDDTGNEMFNVANPHLGDEREFDEIAESFGVVVDVLEPEEFVEKVKTFNDNDQVVELVKLATSREKDLEKFAEYIATPFLKWLEGDKDVFVSKKLIEFLPVEYPSCIMPSWEILRRDLQYAKDIGIFDKFGIKQTLKETD